MKLQLYVASLQAHDVMRTSSDARTLSVEVEARSLTRDEATLTFLTAPETAPRVGSAITVTVEPAAPPAPPRKRQG